MTTTQTIPYTSPLPHPHAWAPTQIAGRTFSVSAGLIHGRTVAVGDEYVGASVTGLRFFTGFAGCPARYYVETDAGEYVITA